MGGENVNPLMEGPTDDYKNAREVGDKQGEKDALDAIEKNLEDPRVSTDIVKSQIKGKYDEAIKKGFDPRYHDIVDEKGGEPISWVPKTAEKDMKKAEDNAYSEEENRDPEKRAMKRAKSLGYDPEKHKVLEFVNGTERGPKSWVNKTAEESPKKAYYMGQAEKEHMDRAVDLNRKISKLKELGIEVNSEGEILQHLDGANKASEEAATQFEKDREKVAELIQRAIIEGKAEWTGREIDNPRLEEINSEIEALRKNLKELEEKQNPIEQKYHEIYLKRVDEEVNKELRQDLQDKEAKKIEKELIIAMEDEMKREGVEGQINEELEGKIDNLKKEWRELNSLQENERIQQFYEMEDALKRQFGMSTEGLQKKGISIKLYSYKNNIIYESDRKHYTPEKIVLEIR